MESLTCGWQNFHIRLFENEIGGFTNVDPLADQFPTWNPYHYVHNNPMLLVDPTGMKSESIHKDEDGNEIARYDDGDNSIYQHDNGIKKEDIDKQREGGEYTDGDGNFVGTYNYKKEHPKYRYDKGESDLEIINATWVGAGVGPVAGDYGTIEIKSPNGESVSSTGITLNYDLANVSLLTVTRGKIVFDEPVSGNTLSELFGNVNVLEQQTFGALFTYQRINGLGNIYKQNRFFHANTFGAGLTSLGYGVGWNYVKF